MKEDEVWSGCVLTLAESCAGRAARYYLFELNRRLLRGGAFHWDVLHVGDGKTPACWLSAGVARLELEKRVRLFGPAVALLACDRPPSKMTKYNGEPYLPDSCVIWVEARPDDMDLAADQTLLGRGSILASVRGLFGAEGGPIVGQGRGVADASPP